MQVHTLFFASYRELVGVPRLSVTLPGGSRARELVVELRARGAPFDRLPERPGLAVNEAWASLDTELGPGDEIAFIPPVAGG
ncbi:MAG: MoaD/ThiS family protein [Gemmatimonadetes bacterium]|nr:MoaD/ThiS family protein [Gemmatimonadota bacterium]MBT8402341.1 MoaD/ThiS family protein [Gemmatimonadota bacterium]NNF38398.1 MoaD/ThiS family protein [Gemmatimonadota bacterium]NNK61751.1 MoaD/ThiS family protein [Gemmatimonadota bacterium]